MNTLNGIQIHTKSRQKWKMQLLKALDESFLPSSQNQIPIARAYNI